MKFKVFICLLIAFFVFNIFSNNNQPIQENYPSSQLTTKEDTLEEETIIEVEYEIEAEVEPEPIIEPEPEADPEPIVQPTPTPPQSTMPGLTSVRVTRVIDGDTIEVIYNGNTERVRLIGINTPERGQAGFNEATNHLEHLISQSNFQVYMRAQGNNRDNFNRLRRCVYNLNRSINHAMVNSGHARSATNFGTC